MKTHCIYTLSILLLLVLFHTNPINAQEVEDEREFEYGTGNQKGPGHWGEIKKEWEACMNGKMQSPIDLSDKIVKIIPSANNVVRVYKPAPAILINRGHDITIKWTGNAGSLNLNGTEYSLQQAHWHSPSEHSINGRRYELELHMIHQSQDGKLAVIGVLYKTGKPDPFLEKLAGKISSITDQKNEAREGVIDPREISMSGRRYYRYIGSLTVPPCTEGVVWTISRKVRSVTAEQVKLLRDAVHDYAATNARPLQPNHKRDVQLYGPIDG